MPTDFSNIDFIRAFIRNVDDLPSTSSTIAKRLADNIESKILNRVDKGNFLGGDWSSKPYSTNPIKAYKLGNATVTGRGMGNKELTINGIMIDRDEWYWGEYDKEKHGVSTSAGRAADLFGDRTIKPVPIFIPGYKEWRVKYNGLSPTVDLSFTGRMLDNFYVDTKKVRGSNQYGSNFEIEFAVDTPFNDIAGMTDFYRNWMSVTQEEIEEAIRESGASIADIFMRPR